MPKKAIKTVSTHAKYGQKGTKEKVFNSAKPIKGKNPNTFRQDPYGKTITKKSMDIDHIKPKSKGGSDSIVNLQAMHPSINRSKGNTLVKKSRHSEANK